MKRRRVEPCNGGDEHNLTDIMFTKESVIKGLKILRTDKCAEIDATHTHIIKGVREEIGGVLADKL